MVVGVSLFVSVLVVVLSDAVSVLIVPSFKPEFWFNSPDGFLSVRRTNSNTNITIANETKRIGVRKFLFGLTFCGYGSGSFCNGTVHTSKKF